MPLASLVSGLLLLLVVDRTGERRGRGAEEAVKICLLLPPGDVDTNFFSVFRPIRNDLVYYSKLTPVFRLQKVLTGYRFGVNAMNKTFCVLRGVQKP